VITTDTLVENPIVAAWVRSSLKVLRESAERETLPFHAELLEPELADSFWVNLIGKGLSGSSSGIPLCTERLKIKPSSRFIERMAGRYGGGNPSSRGPKGRELRAFRRFSIVGRWFQRRG